MVKIFGEFQLSDGRRLVLRSPRWEDLDELMSFINSLVEEGTNITVNRKVTREEEAEWLAELLANIEKGRTIGVVAEVDGKVVGNSEVTRGTGSQGHVGFLGVGVAREYRDLGIGTRMLKTLIEESRRIGLRLLVLDVYAMNARARHVYKKLGFREAGTVPNMACTKNGYVSVIRMFLELD
ncbi:MAG: GNAT family N-acetyltransferase [Candidatus Brockarchaeota archaeon]|nr:GNAT family N-acetyltransferase [Candidatus Brockarchaeota archaeon]